MKTVNSLTVMVGSKNLLCRSLKEKGRDGVLKQFLRWP
jgi:hypothetical protein